MVIQSLETDSLSDGYREGETEGRGRISGTFYIRPAKMKNIKAGIGFNAQRQKTGNFIIWESDTLGYTPNGGADTSNVASTLTYNGGSRVSIDPYIKIYDKNKNLHASENTLLPHCERQYLEPSAKLYRSHDLWRLPIPKEMEEWICCYFW